MRAAVRHVWSPDLERNGGGHRRALIVVDVGAAGDEGEDQFQVQAITPDGLADLLDRDAFVIGRHFLVVRTINFDAIAAFLTDRITRLEADTWDELAAKIGRIGLWEFEDYRPA